MPITLTFNQEKSYYQLIALAKIFPVIIIYGEHETGKHVIVEKFLSEQSNARIVTIDLCKISLQDGNPLHPSKFYNHLITLCQPIDDEFIWIYIRHWDKFKDVMEDYGIEHRYFPRYALSRFSEQMAIGKKQLIITSENDPRLEANTYWSIKHEIKVEDIRSLLTTSLTNEDLDKIIPHIKKARPGQIIQILNYIRAFPNEDPLIKFKEGLVKIYGSNLDPEETVVKTIPDINLIGMEDILKEIETSIIIPLEYGSNRIPLKKGIVLAGPAGTGKTSIGRWLAHRLNGKFYLVDGSTGVSGNNLIIAVSDSLEKAHRNAPSVVFIDDVDLFFEHDDTFRSFLTLLDGIQNKHRGDVCVVVTCMDITRIPPSLIRGGRLELCLETRLPYAKTRERILRLGFDRMIQLFTRFEEEKKINGVIKSLTSGINNKLIDFLVIQTTNWNCADVQRCLDDILRFILANHENGLPPIIEIGKQVIETIRHQYQLVRRPEEKPDFLMMYS